MRVLITGGAGFIGVHTALRFSRTHTVHIIDNLSRHGTESNLRWLQTQGKFGFSKIDIRDIEALRAGIGQFRPDVVIHLAAQVAVTTSVQDPRTDFEINAHGTFNVLEAVRELAPAAVFLYASTNKVYGGMEDVSIELHGNRYRYGKLPGGADESRGLDFHSPYGCSKGCADQYVRDYFRIYGLPTVVFRQSCIYGTRQFGVEDQGWVAWFTICTVLKKSFFIYGDGKQVRDVLWVEDLVTAFERAVEEIETVQGQVFNMGGGPKNTLSLLELIALLEEFSGDKLTYSFSDWRPGDQRVFVANTTEVEKALDWKSQVSPREGVQRLFEWVRANRDLFS